MYINVTSCHFPLIQSLLCNHVMLIRCVTATGACHRHGCASIYLLSVRQPLCLCGRSRRRRAGLRGEAAIGSAGSLHPAPSVLVFSRAALLSRTSSSSTSPTDETPILPVRPDHPEVGAPAAAASQQTQSGPGTLGVMALSSDSSFLKLQEWHRANGGSLRMRDMFEQDKDRFCKFRLEEPCESGCSGEGGGGRWA